VTGVSFSGISLGKVGGVACGVAVWAKDPGTHNAEPTANPNTMRLMNLVRIKNSSE
jgi:hypothetical protein